MILERSPGLILPGRGPFIIVPRMPSPAALRRWPTKPCYAPLRRAPKRHAAISIGTHVKTSSTGTASLTSGSIVTQASGSIFGIVVFWDAGIAFASVADSKSNAYTQLQSELSWAGGTAKIRCYYKENGAGGSGHTFTLNLGASAVCTIYGFEITGGLTASALDVNKVAATNTTPFDATATGVLAQANEIVIAVFGSDSSTNSAVTEDSGNSFATVDTEPNGTTEWVSGVFSKVTAATTTLTASFAKASTTNGAQQVFSFKESSGVATFPPVPDSPRAWSQMNTMLVR